MKNSKKLIFTGLMVLIVVICIEGLARLTYFVMYRRGYDVSDLYDFIKHTNYSFSDEFALWWDEEIIHPYLGFVIDFKNKNKNNETYGFTTSVDPVVKREPGKLNVLVLGGSVAQSMGQILREAFHRVCRVPPNVSLWGKPAISSLNNSWR